MPEMSGAEIAIADMDLDGHKDIVLVSYIVRIIYSATTVDPNAYSLFGADAGHLTLADIDQDGDLDMIDRDGVIIDNLAQ